MAPAEEDPTIKHGEKLEWDVDMEVQLFYAMAGLKPVGINKYFNMVAIWEKLSHSIPKDLATTDIWKHLETLYDLQMLDDTEPIPFPNEETEFTLPDEEYHALIKQKCKEAILNEDFESDVNLLVESPSPKVSKPLRASTIKDKETISKPAAVKKEPAPMKNRKESSSSTDTHTTSRSDRDSSSRRRDSRDSNTSSTRENSASGRKSTTRSSTAALETEPEPDRTRGGRRRGPPVVPPSTMPPAKRKRI